MKALTIWQPWASLIMAGAKPYEFRRWSAPRALHGQRIAIHAGLRPVKRGEIAGLVFQLEHGDPGTGLEAAVALPLLRAWLVAPGKLPLASVLGTAILGTPQPVAALHAAGAITGDSDRIDHHMFGWPLTEIRALEPFVPARGAQGFWDWSEPHG